MAGEISKNMGIPHSASGVRQSPKTAAKKTEKKKTASKAKDSFEHKTVGQDTLDKIPEGALKYFAKGNKVTPLFDKNVTPKNDDDEIFSEIEKMVRGAKKSIQVEMFSLDKKSIVNTLIEEAKRGVKVQVVMDPPNEDFEANKKVAIDKLRKNGVDVQIYPAKEAGSPEAKFGQIDHVKMLIVDGNQAIIGGMNWGEHSPENHDYDVKVEGPAVDKMEWLFRKDWIKSGGDSKKLPYIDKTPEHPEGDAMVNLLTSGLDRKEQTIGFTIRRAIDNAKKSVHAELFVLTDKYTIGKLIDAKKRGVDVKVILNPMEIKGNRINEKSAKMLKDAGVQVKWYVCNPKTKQKLHAKMATFDDDQVIVGSSNWSYSGFKINREADVEVLSKEVNSEFESVFEKDWSTRTSDEPIYLENPDENAGG